MLIRKFNQKSSREKNQFAEKFMIEDMTNILTTINSPRNLKKANEKKIFIVINYTHSYLSSQINL